MQVARWGNSLAIRAPVVVSRALSLVEGDEVELAAREVRLELTKIDRDKIIAEIEAAAVPLPVNWKVDRDFLNSREFETEFETE